MSSNQKKYFEERNSELLKWQGSLTFREVLTTTPTSFQMRDKRNQRGPEAFNDLGAFDSSSYFFVVPYGEGVRYFLSRQCLGAGSFGAVLAMEELSHSNAGFSFTRCNPDQPPCILKFQRKAHRSEFIDENKNLKKIYGPHYGAVSIPSELDYDVYLMPREQGVDVLEYIKQQICSEKRYATRMVNGDAGKVVRRYRRKERFTIARGMILGLKEIRKKGVRVHRDIKHNNMVFDPHKKQVKYIDFGVAVLNDGWNQSAEKTTVVGLPYFRSPEGSCYFHAGSNEIAQLNPARDVYSVAQNITYALTGNLPTDYNSSPRHMALREIALYFDELDQFYLTHDPLFNEVVEFLEVAIQTDARLTLQNLLPDLDYDSSRETLYDALVIDRANFSTHWSSIRSTITRFNFTAKKAADLRRELAQYVASISGHSQRPGESMAVLNELLSRIEFTCVESLSLKTICPGFDLSAHEDDLTPYATAFFAYIKAQCRNADDDAEIYSHEGAAFAALFRSLRSVVHQKTLEELDYDFDNCDLFQAIPSGSDLLDEREQIRLDAQREAIREELHGMMAWRETDEPNDNGEYLYQQQRETAMVRMEQKLSNILMGKKADAPVEEDYPLNTDEAGGARMLTDFNAVEGAALSFLFGGASGNSAELESGLGADALRSVQSGVVATNPNPAPAEAPEAPTLSMIFNTAFGEGVSKKEVQNIIKAFDALEDYAWKKKRKGFNVKAEAIFGYLENIKTASTIDELESAVTDMSYAMIRNEGKNRYGFFHRKALSTTHSLANDLINVTFKLTTNYQLERASMLQASSHP